MENNKIKAKFHVDHAAIEFAEYLESEMKLKKQIKASLDFEKEFFKYPPNEDLARLIDTTYLSQFSNFGNPEVIMPFSPPLFEFVLS